MALRHCQTKRYGFLRSTVMDKNKYLVGAQQQLTWAQIPYRSFPCRIYANYLTRERVCVCAFIKIGLVICVMNVKGNYVICWIGWRALQSKFVGSKGERHGRNYIVRPCQIKFLQELRSLFEFSRVLKLQIFFHNML